MSPPDWIYKVLFYAQITLSWAPPPHFNHCNGLYVYIYAPVQQPPHTVSLRSWRRSSNGRRTVKYIVVEWGGGEWRSNSSCHRPISLSGPCRLYHLTPPSDEQQRLHRPTGQSVGSESSSRSVLHCARLLLWLLLRGRLIPLSWLICS